MSYKNGDHAFIIISNRWVRPVTILRRSGSLYVLSLGHQAGVTLPENRLYATEAEATKMLNPWYRMEASISEKVVRSPYSFRNERSAYGI